MEKEKRHGVLAVKKKHIVASLALSAALSAMPTNRQSEGHEEYNYAPVPREYFSPITIYDSTIDDKPELLVPLVNIEKENPTQKPLSKQEKKELKMKQELKDIVNIMKEHNFSSKYIKDVKMYYPIYEEVAQKFNLDWYLIWIVHEKETGASAGQRGFAPNAYYKDAMQIAPFWQKYAKQASKDLEDLKKLPQRHKNDWEQIALGAWILNRNIDKSVKNGTSNNEAVHKALRLYSADGPADERFSIYKKYKDIFKS